MSDPAESEKELAKQSPADETQAKSPASKDSIPNFMGARSLWVGLALSCLSAAIGGLLIAALEFAELQDVSAVGVVALLGLLAPLLLAIGLVVGAVARWLHRGGDQGWPALSQLSAVSDPKLIAARALTLSIAALLGLVALSSLGLGFLVSDLSAGSSAVAGALGACAVTLLLVGGALRSAEWLSPRLPAALTPRRAVLISSALFVVGLLLLVWSGDTSGAGGPWQILGTLRREELDLRAPAYLLLIALAAYQLPSLLARVPTWAAIVGALLPLGLTVGGAAWFDDDELRLGTERSTALTKPLLRAFQSLLDGDNDGFAGAFGGGDCNDTDPAINPDADDVPGNGVDEDCIGGDAQSATAGRPGEPPADEQGVGEQGAGQPGASATAGAAAAAESTPEQLNVMFISIDTLRWDLGYMGYERNVSPRLDELAEKSVVFEYGYALASYTSKSMAPLMIGRYGMETNRGWRHFNKYPEKDVMVQERLQAAGIRTVSVQGHWYFTPEYGIGRGFDVLDLSASPKTPQTEGDKTINSDKISDAAIEQLSALEGQEQRFFMWVHYLDPHSKYMPHEQFAFGKKSRDLYDGEVAFTDFHVGRLLDALAASPLAKNTAIFVTSDHGEAFGEHGMIRHGFELWEELIRVPYIVYFPGVTPRRETARRGSIDFAPTFMELLGVPLPTGDDALSGQSLVKDVRLPPGHTPERRPVFIDMQAGPYNTERQAWLEGDYKLITSSSRPMGVYNLKDDPGEKKNLMKDRKLTQRLLDNFKQYRSGLRRIRVKPLPKGTPR